MSNPLNIAKDLAMNLLHDLPNQDGFKFIGIDKQGNEHFCIVRKKSGRYVMNSNTVVWPDLAGWRDATYH